MVLSSLWVCYILRHIRNSNAANATEHKQQMNKNDNIVAFILLVTYFILILFLGKHKGAGCRNTVMTHIMHNVMNL